jgi:stress response protein SCP2
MPENVETLYFVINSFTNQHFEQIKEARCEITERNSGEIAIQQSLTDISGPHTALVLCKFKREGGNWTAIHIDYPCKGRTVMDLIDVVKRHNL